MSQAPNQWPWGSYDRMSGYCNVAREDCQSTPEMGRTRGFVRLWDIDAEGIVKGSPPNAWQRGELVRRAQPVFVLTSMGPMYDPSDPSTWRPGL